MATEITHAFANLSVQQQAVLSSMKECSPQLSDEDANHILHQGITYAQEHPGEVGKIDRKKTTIPRSLFISDSHQPYALMTRVTTCGDKSLGEGAFKQVDFGISLFNGEKIAVGITDSDVKTTQVCAEKKMIRAQREAEILELFKTSLYIVQLVGKSLSIGPNGQTRYYLLTEYCDGGELFDRLAQDKEPSVEEKKCWSLELLTAIKDIHRQGIIHRDLKPENILLKMGDDRRWHIKIADFGLACTQEEAQAEECPEPVGAPGWLAPECMGRSDFPRDIWAAAEIIQTIFTSLIFSFQDPENPTPLLTAMSLQNSIVQLELRENKAALTAKGLNEGRFKLLSEMLQVNPKERPTAREALDTWIRSESP